MKLVLKGVVGTMLDQGKTQSIPNRQNERRKDTKSHLFGERWREEDNTVIREGGSWGTRCYHTGGKGSAFRAQKS